MGYSLWGHKELDTTEEIEHVLTHTHLYMILVNFFSPLFLNYILMILYSQPLPTEPSGPHVHKTAQAEN